MGGHEVTHLLDTNVWLFGYATPEAIPETIQNLLNASDTLFGLCAISLWEVGKKHQIGKLHLKKDLTVWLNDALAANIQVLQITPEVVANAMALPDFPNRDPADELIVATARVHKLTLLTADTKLKKYRHAKIHYFTPTVTT